MAGNSAFVVNDHRVRHPVDAILMGHHSPSGWSIGTGRINHHCIVDAVLLHILLDVRQFAAGGMHADEDDARVVSAYLVVCQQLQIVVTGAASMSPEEENDDFTFQTLPVERR